MKFGLLALPVLLLAGAAPAQAPAPPPSRTAGQQATAPGVDPQAMASAERSRAYLRTLQSFEVRADATIEEVLDDNTKIDLGSRVRYEYRAPDRLFIGWQTDRGERRLYYDGKMLTVFSPGTGNYARMAASGSVADLLKRLADDYGVVFPLPDLFLWASSTAKVQEPIERATYIGPARIAATQTDHYLFRQKGVDWQIWNERSDRPVPRKIVITDRSDPAQPSFSAVLQWNPGVQLPDDHFAFTPPAGAKSIELGKVQLEDGQ